MFWMEFAALLGTAVKYAEVALSVRFRRRGGRGGNTGGPMYSMEALPRPLRKLGKVYAPFGMLTAFGVGNLTQSNAIGAAGTAMAARRWPSLSGEFAALGAGASHGGSLRGGISGGRQPGGADGGGAGAAHGAGVSGGGGHGHGSLRRLDAL